tara:strand:+ start:2660 stop:3085 length:426 start_codon:yes stop_codon:yes gene_type:complete
MVRVTAKITNKPRYRSVLKDYEGDLRALIGRAGNLVRNTAVTSVNQGVKTGGVSTRYNPRRTHTASAAGQPPATDTGFLATNIVLEIDVNQLGASVESRANYSTALEFGTSKMAARPFMQPALEENKPKINRLAKQMIKAK